MLRRRQVCRLLALALLVDCGSDGPTGPGGGPGQLAFVGHRILGQADLFLINADGSGLVRLTPHLADDLWPSWSPDGTRLVFVSDRDDLAGDLYIVTVADSTVVRVTADSGASDDQPAWSPDGSRIAFASDRSGSGDIYVMNDDGTGVVRLTSDTARDLTPAWSPDGGQIAFMSNRDGDFALWVMDADGSNARRVTESDVPDELPHWSPDGTRLAFDSDRRVWVVWLDGRGVSRVTGGPLDLMPRWRPMP
jgi:TolB protein